jgi:hypothetical protein
MARITTNTQGTQPVIKIAYLGSNLANVSETITVPYVQEITITNSTGVYTYTDFSDADQRKLSTPADNKVTTNIVVDSVAYFGNSAGTANTAVYDGIAVLSTNKTPLTFEVYWNGTASGAYTYTGNGFITNLAPKTTPTQPVWITPMEIAVDGSFTVGTVS